MSALTIGSLIDLSFTGGTYGIYVVTGYIVKKHSTMFKLNRYVLMIIGLICLFLLILFQYWTYEAGADRNLQYNVWYNNALLFISAFSTFLFFVKGVYKKNIKYITWMSRVSFGIFLIHYLFIDSLSSILPIANHFLKTCIIFITTLSLCNIFMILIEKNHKIARMITYK